MHYLITHFSSVFHDAAATSDKFHDHKTWVQEKILVFTIYGHGSCLCHLSWILFIHFPLSYKCYMALIVKVVLACLKEKICENGGQMMDPIYPTLAKTAVIQ